MIYTHMGPLGLVGDMRGKLILQDVCRCELPIYNSGNGWFHTINGEYVCSLIDNAIEFPNHATPAHWTEFVTGDDT